MKSSQIQNSQILTAAFGKSGVFETVRKLREIGKFPSYHQGVTFLDVARLLFCLAANEKVPNTEQSSRDFDMLQSKQGVGISEFLTMLLRADEKLINDVKEIKISRKGYGAQIQVAGYPILFTSDGRPQYRDLVCTLTAEFVYELAKELAHFEFAESVNANPN